MKKSYLLLPFFLGISAAVLTAVTAFVVAMDECNEHERSDHKQEWTACAAAFSLSSCTTFSGADCNGKQGVMMQNGPNTERYFGRTESGKAGDHAVVAGTVLCGYVYNCSVDNNGQCVASAQQAISPKTGKPIERRIAYYDNDDCYDGG